MTSSQASLIDEDDALTLISPSRAGSVAPIMPPDTIIVAPLSRVEDTVATVRVSHLITLINTDTPVPTPPSVGKDRHLRLGMNDICEPAQGLVAPHEDHIAELVRFTLDWDRKAPLLIHCWAGISRSTAAAFVALCALDPGADERHLARKLRKASPTAYPNRRLVQLGDLVLARSGRMIEAVEEIGRGAIAEEGQVFALSVRPVD